MVFKMQCEKVKQRKREPHYNKVKVDARPMPSQSASQERAYAEKHRLVVQGKVTIHKCL